jgi:hypothetical protein
VSAPEPGSLTPRLQELVHALQAARSRLLEAVAGLDQARLDAAPADGQWSIGEILHHLQLIEGSVARVLARQVQRAEKTGDGPDPRQDSVLASLDRFDIERSPEKIDAPSGFLPRRGFSLQELRDGLADSRAALFSEVARAGAHDLSRLTFPHPVLGRLDMYQWLLYCAQHELRHLHQIQRVRG